MFKKSQKESVLNISWNDQEAIPHKNMMFLHYNQISESGRADNSYLKEK